MRSGLSLADVILLVEATMPISQLSGRLADALDSMRPVDQPAGDPIADNSA